MKWLFFLLLLANLAFLAVMAAGGKREGDSRPGLEPLNAAKITLLPAGQPQPAAEPEESPPVCMVWGNFGAREQERAQQALATQPFADSVQVQPAEETRKYWIYLPPFKSKAEAQKKAEELKSLEVGDLFVVQEDSQWRHAISLGIFVTEAAAAKHLAQLRAKGVKGLKMRARASGKQANLLVSAHGRQAAAELAKIAEDFPGSEVREVVCPAEDSGARPPNQDQRPDGGQ